MKGRLENELKNKNHINNILSVLPPEIADFYQTLQVSLETTTCLNYIQKIHNFMKASGYPQLNEITTPMIATYINNLKYYESPAGETKKASSSYLQGTWTALNRLFTYLCDTGVIERNPVSTISRPKTKGNIKRKFIQEQDVKNMIESAKSGRKYNGYYFTDEINDKWKERDVLILTLLICTGMRRTALTEINVGDISLKDKTITVIDKRQKENVYIITDKLEVTIRQWLEKRKEILGKQKCDALFISDRLTRISSKTVYRIVQRYSLDALGEKYSPHKIRGAFITGTYEHNGHDIEAAREAAGHSSISTTSIYIRRSNDSRKAAVQSMSDFILGSDE